MLDGDGSENADNPNENEEVVAKKTITLDEIMDGKSDGSQSAHSNKEGEAENDEEDEESNNRYYEIFVNEIRRKEQLE